MKKLFALLLACLMIAGIFAGCAPKDEGSVYWLNFKPESDEALQKVAAMYTEKTGVPVKVVTAASGTYNQTLTAEMDKTEAPTLFVVGNQAAVETWGEYCLDLAGTDIYNELNTDAYILKDAEGNTFTWKTTNGLGIDVKKNEHITWESAEEGQTVVLKGTVKEHNEYNGEKQTVLTRCKVSEIR